MQPFFSYFGGKWRSAPHYPRAMHATVIEPFAGSAGYAVRNFDKDVILIEKNAKVAAVWKYLIETPSDEILSLPDIERGKTVDDYGLSDGAKWLIGFWLNKGGTHPRRIRSAWMELGTHDASFWGISIKKRISENQKYIRHWQIVHGSYRDAPEIAATWFIDPPYQVLGSYYPESAKKIDFFDLSDFCRTRLGQVIVCENAGADWLPFEPFNFVQSYPGRTTRYKSNEVIWTNKTDSVQVPLSSLQEELTLF